MIDPVEGGVARGGERNNNEVCMRERKRELVSRRSNWGPVIS